jgi:hypothetical protein
MIDFHEIARICIGIAVCSAVLLIVRAWIIRDLEDDD